MSRKTIPLLFLLCCCGLIRAQQSAVSAGGDATSTSGSVSYSIGQACYINETSSTSNLNQGVQQPYEFFIITTVDAPDPAPDLSVYPNPLRDFVTLNYSGAITAGLKYNLFDQLGNLIATQSILTQQTEIRMDQLAMATYMLQIVSADKTIKTFQIIKNF
jgi:hypothetical protein